MHKLAFIGNSHLICSVIPAYAGEATFTQCNEDWAAMRITHGQITLEDDMPAEFISCNMHAVWPVDDAATASTCPLELLRLLDMLPPDVATIVLMIRGNEFAYESLVDTPPHWDFLGEHRSADPERLFVQSQDVAAHLELSVRPMFNAHVAVRERFPEATVLHAAAPPPFGDDSQILSDGGLGAFAELADRYGVRRFQLRRKIYDLMYGQLAQRLAQVGVETVFAPAECVTRAGALKDEYALDCVHGNADFGRALVTQIQHTYIHASVRQPA